MFKKSMKTLLVGAATALAIAGAGLSATSASADPWRGGGHEHDGGWRDPGGGWRDRGDLGAALGLGILGVAIGESLSHPYYGPPPAAYAGPGYWGYYGDCRAYWRWSPRFHRYVRVDRCY